MKTVVFIANYKKNKNLQDGMMQRIINIDNKFEGYCRTYLNLSYKRSKINNELINKNLKLINANPLKNYSEIKQILKQCDNIYVHSIYNYFRIIPYINILKNKNITLDLHGAVPEELKMYNKYIKYAMFKFIEKSAFKRCSNFIFVNKAMEEYYERKYNFILNKNKIVYPILTNNVIESQYIDECINNELEEFTGKSKNIFIYSGNTQKWQNIDMMMEIIKKLALKDENRFIILSKEVEKFKQKFIENNIKEDKYMIKSVNPENLSIYYNKAKYGFILRDDCTVNRIANPTKMIEYLSYGIIPIVKLSSIGDFENFNYEYIYYKEIENSCTNVEKYKSSKNIEIVNKIIDSSKHININEIVIRG